MCTVYTREVYTVHMTTRDQILRAAKAIHERSGLQALTMRRVSARVRLSPMALYRHFADKDALLDALVADGFAQFEHVVSQAADAPTAEQRLRAMLHGYVDFALANPRTFELMFFVPRTNVPVAPASLAASPSPGFSRIIAAVHEAMREGTIAADDPAQVLLLAWGTIHGLVALHFSGRFGYDDAAFRHIVDDQIERFMRVLARAPSPPTG